MAKASILKLLKFDDDLREALCSGRRLRNCTVHRRSTEPIANAKPNPGELRLIGMTTQSDGSGKTVAAAVCLRSINWNQGLKSELERLNSNSKSALTTTRNKLSQSLLESTVWSALRINKRQAEKIGSAQAGQIATLKAIDHVLQRLNPHPETVVILASTGETISTLKYTQAEIANGLERSACLAAAHTVAQTYLLQLSKKGRRARTR